MVKAEDSRLCSTAYHGRVLGLIADDLTGAGDASVQFAKRGWDVFLALRIGLKPDTTDTTAEFPAGSDASRTVIALTTDCRALSNDAAETLTANAMTALMRAGADRVFLKIDSTMRGSVPGQIAGALAAWRTRHAHARAIVCPAYPRMGRTVESNQVLVHGAPVDRTSIGGDLVTPVKTSSMLELIPYSPMIQLADAATDADLMHIAESISVSGPSVVPVGSGGLAEAFAATLTVGRGGSQPDRRALQVNRALIPRRENSRILLQVSSLNPVSHAQVVRLKAAFPDVVVLLPPAERGDSAAVAANLAREFAEQVAREEWDILGLVGGDGARETLARLGASGIRIVDSLVEGIPLGVVVGGDADGTPVFTKAGGFGAEDALVRCVERMTA